MIFDRMLSTKEEWKAIPSFPAYEASTLGRVRIGRTIKVPRKCPSKYTYYRIRVDGRSVNKIGHRLVAEAFFGNIRGKVVNHKNRDPEDNRVENLEMVSYGENSAHLHSGLTEDYSFVTTSGKERPETWKSVLGFGVYEVSTKGGVRRGKKYLRTPTGKNGYNRVNLCVGGKPTQRTVHRLVAETFIGVVEGFVVNHRNRNRVDNDVSNLEIISCLENNAHAIITRRE